MTRKEQAAASRSELVEAARLCFTASGIRRHHRGRGILERAGMARVLSTTTSREERMRSSPPFSTRSTRPSTSGGTPFRSWRHRWPVCGPGLPYSLDMCSEDDFAPSPWPTLPRSSPDRVAVAAPTRLCATRWSMPSPSAKLVPLDHEVIAMALYGAVRSAGEYVIVATTGPRP